MKKGFTLMELLITLTIIAVLAGIAFPIGRSMLEKSREAACLSNLKAIGVGLQFYIQDHNNTLPTLALGRASRLSEEPVLETVLSTYIENEDVFHCPEDSEQFAKTGSSYNWNITQNGRLMSQLSFLGLENRPESIPLVSDKESWHPGGTNFLYADSSASNKVRFVTGGEQ